MSKVFYYMKQYYLWLIVAVVMLFIQAMCDLALPDYMSDIVNDGVMGGSIPLIAKYGLKMIGVTLLGTVVSVFVGYLAANVAAKVSRDMRKTCIKRWNCSQMPNLIILYRVTYNAYDKRYYANSKFACYAYYQDGVLCTDFGRRRCC